MNLFFFFLLYIFIIFNLQFTIIEMFVVNYLAITTITLIHSEFLKIHNIQCLLVIYIS